MKHKTWFRLVIKAIGILLIGLSMPGVVPGFVHMVQAIFEWLGTPVTNQILGWNWPWYVGSFVQLLAGLYLFFGGKWIVNKCIPSNRAYCPECGYQIETIAGENCPECGVVLPRERLIEATKYSSVNQKT